MSKGSSPTDADVCIIGAGISGINAGYRLHELASQYSYTILESRDVMGGTWSFFNYPGLRGDSDLYTFGFPWRPWTEKRSIASGDSIISYIKETAEMFGIDKKIQYNHKVQKADWSSDAQRWRLEVEVSDASGSKQTKVFNPRFIIFGTGYYDYEQPLQTTIAGLENFKGMVVHPQFWPANLDYTGKKMVIIGSGATSITLLPALADKASHVTMLQRSPTYILSMPNRGDDWASRYLPQWLAYRVNRFKFMWLATAMYWFCRTFPERARKAVMNATLPLLPEGMTHDPHFTPKYNPWEQRMCFCPDGDFYDALRGGKTSVATGHIDTMTDSSIILKSGEKLDADIIVTATGLKLQCAGGIKLSVDGEPYHTGKKFMWKATMLQDLPNAAIILGYTNASWTLGADAAAQMIVRLLNDMDKNGSSSIVPRKKLGEGGNLSADESPPVLGTLNSTYIKTGMSVLPKVGTSGQWKDRSMYLKDWYDARWGDVTTGLRSYRIST